MTNMTLKELAQKISKAIELHGEDAEIVIFNGAGDRIDEPMIVGLKDARYVKFLEFV